MASTSHTYPQLALNAHAWTRTIVGGNCQLENSFTRRMVLGANLQGGMSQIGSHSQGGTSLHTCKLIGGHGRGWGWSSGRIGSNGKNGETTILRQQHGNWEPAKVLALISYKHVEQVI
jgi:hypothetical protein